MPVFRAIVLSAALVGLLVGAVVTLVQHFGTLPLIEQGEVYERAAATADSASGNQAGHDHQDHGPAAAPQADHDHGAAAWEPREGLERHSFTAVANVLTAIGFALLLAGIYAMRAQPVTWHEGLLWGLAGFLVFTIAPGLGLPPELPACRRQRSSRARSGGSALRPRPPAVSLSWCSAAGRGRLCSASP